MSTPIRVGIVGAGYISAAYLQAAREFREIAIVSCADALRTNTETRAEEFGLRAQDVDELFEDKSIDLVLNLTTPQSHVPISLQALWLRTLVPDVSKRCSSDMDIVLLKIKLLSDAVQLDNALQA
jgi:predicted dinucleotide-utilizing enzyme